MIHETQLKIQTPNRRIPGGQNVGCPSPSIEVTHWPSGCSITIRNGRSNHQVKEVALEALEYALLSMGEKPEDLAYCVTGEC